MIRIHISVIMAFLAVSASHPALARDGDTPAFLQNLNDIPLMPGLYEVLEEGVVFDQPDGRIVEAEAVTQSAQRTEIKSFYSQTLPQLGWKKAGADSFTRDGETLKIAIEEGDSEQIVHFTVAPRL